jgi:hypothetical protein
VSGFSRTASEPHLPPKATTVVARPQPIPVVRPTAPAPVVVAAKPKAPLADLAPKEAAIVARPQPVAVVRPPAPAPIVVAPRPKVPPAAFAPKEAANVARPQSAPAVRPPAPPPIVAAAKRQEWLELIDSLRLDVDRLRAGRDQADPVVSAKPKEAVASAKPKDRRAPALASAAKNPTKRLKKGKPIQDEWGFFDPEQCGFAALLAKLDEITEEDPEFDPEG